MPRGAVRRLFLGCSAYSMDAAPVPDPRASVNDKHLSGSWTACRQPGAGLLISLLVPRRGPPAGGVRLGGQDRVGAQGPGAGGRGPAPRSTRHGRTHWAPAMTAFWSVQRTSPLRQSGFYPVSVPARTHRTCSGGPRAGSPGEPCHHGVPRPTASRRLPAAPPTGVTALATARSILRRVPTRLRRALPAALRLLAARHRIHD